jgi:hypothetical protein
MHDYDDDKHTTVQFNIAHIVREHKEKATKRRAEQKIPQVCRQNRAAVSPLLSPTVSDDAT